MKTSLHFEAPTDLSVGTVRIVGMGRTIADWIATPDKRIFRTDDLRPGVYSVEICPVGVAPQSVVFEVREGQVNNVVLPSFSALSSSGSNINFFDSDSLQTVSELPHSMNIRFSEELELPRHYEEALSAVEAKIIPARKESRWADVSKFRRRISVGLSEERQGRDTFDTFRGQSTMELLSGRLEIEIPTDPNRNHWAGRRSRLSVAIEQVRIERCLLPFYQGGTRITIAAPPFAPSDFEFSIMPVDPKLRALVRALDAGTLTEVTAVRDDVLGQYDPAALLAEEADPWRAILVGLLAIRFPEIFGPIDATWAAKLVARADWAFDAHVIRASQALSATADAASEAQDEAVTHAVAFLAKAQVTGSPYYRYTNQLFADMATGIADYITMSKPHIDPAVIRKFNRLNTRWHRELPLQRGSGPTFTWLARDLIALRKKALVPYRKPSGKLRHRDTLILFEGWVSAGQIEIIGGSSSPTQSASIRLDPSTISVERLNGIGSFYVSESLVAARESPSVSMSPSTRRYRLETQTALSNHRMTERLLGTLFPELDNDPNKNKFGGQSRRDGFRLSASFEPTTSRDWVTVVLLVEADRSVKIGLGDVARFVLHPTFSPPALNVSFRGNRAQLRIQAWGGFTVGVSLPRAGVELECDLAQIEDAPRIIRVR